MMHGLKGNTVQLFPYETFWVDLYEREAQFLQNLMGSFLQRVEHVGSTAIPGLSAKPIIDIICEVQSRKGISEFIQQLELREYEYLPHALSESRCFFAKGSKENRTHHLSFFDAGSEIFQMHIVFRDYLKNNPSTAHAYLELKERLASQFSNDRASYGEGKQKFILDVIERARQEGYK